MHRTQLLLPEGLLRDARRLAAADDVSLGSVVREAVAQYVATRSSSGAHHRDPLLDDPFDDPEADSRLSVDVDHHLYGAPRRSRARPKKKKR